MNSGLLNDNYQQEVLQYKVLSEGYESRIIDLESQLKLKDNQIAELIETNERLTKQLYDEHINDSLSHKNGDEEFSEPEQFRKLFVGGLNYTTTSEILSQHFSKFGDVMDCVVMKDPATKRSRGFGFIVFSRVAMVDGAQAARPHYIDGREVETKRAVPKGEQLPYEKQMRVKKIFVGGLKETTNEESLNCYFSQYGRVNHVDLIEDRQTKRKRGFAYVTFNDCDPVDKAVLQKFHTIDGRRCEVKKAISRAEMCLISGQQINLPFGTNNGPHTCPCQSLYSSNLFHRCCLANRFDNSVPGHVYNDFNQRNSSQIMTGDKSLHQGMGCFTSQDKGWMMKQKNFNNSYKQNKNGIHLHHKFKSKDEEDVF